LGEYHEDDCGDRRDKHPAYQCPTPHRAFPRLAIRAVDQVCDGFQQDQDYAVSHLQHAACQPVDRALQDHGGGMAVDRGGALGAAHVLPDHRGFGGLRRPAFVPQEEGEGKGFGTIAGIGAAGLRARAFGTIHIARQAEDDAFDAAAADQRGQRLAVLAPLAALDGGAVGGKAPAGIAGRGAERLGAEIEAQQHAAFTSALVFAQNSGRS